MAAFYESTSTVQTAVGETQKYLSQLPDAKDAAAWSAQKARELVAAGKTGALTALEQGKAAAYQYAYAQARDLLFQISQNEIVKRINEVGNSGMAAAEAANSVVKIFQKGKIDSAGVVDMMKHSQVVFDSLGRLAVAFGASAQAIEQISLWTNLATGCVGGIAQNPVLGVVGCAASAVINVLAVIFGQSGFVAKPEETPAAYFAPNMRNAKMAAAVPTQGDLINADAVRLASVLKYCYGYDSFASLVKRLTEVEENFSVLKWWSTAYPMAPQDDSTANGPTPIGMDMLSWLICLDRHADDVDVAYANVRAALDFLCVLRASPSQQLTPFAENQWVGEYLLGRAGSEGDVNVSLIELGAWVARGAIEKTGRPCWRVNVNHSREFVPRLSKWNFDNNLWATSKTISGTRVWEDRTVEVDFYPFLVADELLNYFSAVSRIDYRTFDPARTVYAGTQGLPIRFYGVEEAGKRYGRNCWTSLTKARRKIVTQCFLDKAASAGEDLPALCRDLDEDALKELGFIRLLSAASQLYLQWRWGESNDSAKPGDGDMVARLPDVSPADPLWLLRSPVSPRQVAADPELGIPGMQQTFALRTGEVKYGPVVMDHGSFMTSAYAMSAQGLVDTGTQGPVAEAARAVAAMTGGGRGLTSVLTTPPRTRIDGQSLAGAIDQRQRDIGEIVAAAQRQAMTDNVAVMKTYYGPAWIAKMKAKAELLSKEGFKEQTAQTLLRVEAYREAVVPFRAECEKTGGQVVVTNGNYTCVPKSNVGLALGIAAAAALWLKFRS